MNEAERLLKNLREGQSAIMNVPLSLSVNEAAKVVRQFGQEHGMQLSIVPMITVMDQKLAIGPGIQVAASHL